MNKKLNIGIFFCDQLAEKVTESETSLISLFKTLGATSIDKNGEVQLSGEIGEGGLKFRKTKLYNYY